MQGDVSVAIGINARFSAAAISGIFGAAGERRYGRLRLCRGDLHRAIRPMQSIGKMPVNLNALSSFQNCTIAVSKAICGFPAGSGSPRSRNSSGDEARLAGRCCDRQANCRPSATAGA